jgi:hypothetical protein
MTRGLKVAVLLLAAGGLAQSRARITAQVAPQESAARRSPVRVLVLSGTAEDARIELAHAATAFWNRAFDELGLDPVLAEPEVVVALPATRTLENYAWQMSRQAGRLSSGSEGPPPPEALTGLDADVIMLLSAQRLMSFAWPLESGESRESSRRRYFLAIADDPRQDLETTREVIAHELGHALGLKHNRNDPTSLMCQPCGGVPRSSQVPGLVLTEKERVRLVQLYGVARTAP